MLAIFAPMISWIFRGVVIKFLILTAVFAVLAIAIPAAIALIVPHISTAGLSSAFSGIDSGVWWFLDFFALDYGIPLIISAYVARFLIRRLPLIG
jgi:Protein of unknown function (DUF2523)